MTTDLPCVPDAQRLRNLARRVKAWTTDVEADKRTDERYGLQHRPRSSEELKLLHIQETRELKETVLQGVDTLRAIVSNDVTTSCRQADSFYNTT